MVQSDLLELVSHALEPFVQSGQSLSDIRDEIAGYVQHLAASNNASNTTSKDRFTLPDHIRGVRKQYLEAVQRREIAAERLAALQSSVNGVDHGLAKETDFLKLHVERSMLQRLHQDLDIISYRTSKVDELGYSHQVHDAYISATDTSLKKAPVDERMKPTYVTDALDLIKRLENAVLNTCYLSDHERRLKDSAEIQRGQDPNPSLSSRLRALLATRSELTDWIESSLAKCDTERDMTFSHVEASETGNEPCDADVEKRYEEYIQARERLLQSVAVLHDPITPTQRTLPSPVIRPREVQHQPLLASVEARLLPLEQHTNVLQQHEAHLLQIVSQAQHRLVEDLNRLSDESHLLPSYPILAKRRTHQRSRPDATRELISQSSFDKVADLMESWKFAAEAATTSMSETVNKECKTAHDALDSVSVSHDRTQLQKAAWSDVDMR